MSDLEDTHAQLQIESNAKAIAGVRKRAEAMASAAGYDERTVGEIGLCINEALANVIRHAYHNVPGQPIVITLDVDESRFQTVIRDWGSGDLPDPNADHVRDQFAPGGLGLLCLRRLMDEVRYQLQPDGMKLTMRREKNPA
ncbi:MAG: ATP-binding protein [Planctomycetota bacterium]